MKKISALAVAMLFVAGCQNFDLNPFDSNKEDTPNPCPTVSADAVPAAVTSAFQELYPQVTVTTWFNKDNTGYCALFTDHSIKKLVRISNDGTFVNEELITDQQQEDHHCGGSQGHNCGNPGNSGNSDSGCECDTKNN